jgi:hypothetical protein
VDAPEPTEPEEADPSDPDRLPIEDAAADGPVGRAEPGLEAVPVAKVLPPTRGV